MILLAILVFIAGAGLRAWFLADLLRLAALLALAIMVGVAAEVINAWAAFDVFVVTLCMQVGFVIWSAFKPYVRGAP